MKVKTIGPPNAKIMLVGEAPGADEDRCGIPFVGNAGKILNQLLGNAGIVRQDVVITNIARERPPGNKIDFFYEDKKRTLPKPILQMWIEELREDILFYNPNIIIALGATATFHLTGIKGIEANRGYICESSLVKGKKVLPTYHPQAVGYDWKLAMPTILDLRKAVKNSETPDVPKDERRVRAHISLGQFMSYLEWLAREWKGPIALDLEVTQPGAHISVIGIAHSSTDGMSYEILRGRQPTISADSEFRLWNLFLEVVNNCSIIAQNGKFDLSVLMETIGIYCPHFMFDTMIAAHVCWPELPRSLGFLSSVCLDVPAWKQTAGEDLVVYNCLDAINTFGVCEVLQEELEKLELIEIFEEEMRQNEPAMLMELNGLYVDSKKQKEYAEELRKRLEELYTEITEAVGREINLRSPKQMKELLYVDLELPAQYKRRKNINEKRKLTTNAEALKTLEIKTGDETLTKIIEWKKKDKLLNSFIDIELSPRSTVHTCYNITGATMQRSSRDLVMDDEGSYKSFGRWSSSSSIILPYGGGNLQNIPKEARKMYTAPKGKVFLQADYMQAEAVVVAYCINDVTLKNMFTEAYGLTKEARNSKSLDIHKQTASMMFGVPIEEVTADQRDIGKRIRHATHYSAGPKVVAHALGVPTAESKELLKRFHNACPQLHIWHQRIQNELRQTRVLTNLLGRKHRFLERWGDSLFRSAYSFIPQSTVGDLLNRAMVRLYRDYHETIDIVIQLHDAIYTLVDEEKVEESMYAIKECMTIPLTLDEETFYIDVDFSVGPSWGDMEEVDGPQS